MKKNIFFTISLFILLTSNIYSQFDKPVIMAGIGIAQPMGDMSGTYYTYLTQPSGFQYIAVNPDLFTNNYGAKTGLSFFGNGKINFDKYGITRGVLGIGFNTFNTFESSKNGNIGELFRNPNTGNIDTLPIGANFNYTFSVFNISIGAEIAPTSFTNKISPYFGARLTLNTFNAHISWTSNSVDTTHFSASDFRVGAVFDAGIEVKFNKTFGMVLGANYNLGNLIGKNTDNSISSNHIWGKSNASINDANGQFWSTLYDPVLTGINSLYNSKDKKINWGTIYLGLNIYLNTGKSSKQLPKK